MCADRVLLFDDAHVERKRGFKPALHLPARDPEPVVRPDRTWESGGIVGDSNVTVIDDGGVIRLWYVIADPRSAGARPVDPDETDEKLRNDMAEDTRYMLCYAESTDGITFEKPELGLVEFEGSSKNNMLLAGRMGCTVFIDPTAPPEARFKLIHGFGPRLPHVRPGRPVRMIFHGIYGSTSPDGIRWTTHPEPILPWYTDTTNVAYWDDRTGRYVAFCRWNQNLDFRDNQTVVIRPGAEHYRAIGRSESEDFFRFPAPEKIAEPSPAERRPRRTGMDYYNTSAVKYAGSADAYFMFSSDFHHEPDVLDVHLATSRDGVAYFRWKEPILRLGPEGAFDARQVYMGTGMVRRGPELWMYYTGQRHNHGDTSVRGTRHGGIGRVRFRMDGFVSQRAGASLGKMLTRPVRFSGERLRVNMDASAAGRLKVELRNVGGEPVSGHTAQDADWLYSNDVSRTVTWRGRPDLSRLDRQSIRLNFIGKSVDLYSFEFE